MCGSHNPEIDIKYLIVAPCQAFSRYFGLHIRPFFKFQVLIVLGKTSVSLLVNKEQEFQHYNTFFKQPLSLPGAQVKKLPGVAFSIHMKTRRKNNQNGDAPGTQKQFERS